MPVEPVAPSLRGPTLSAQNWRNLAFLHWAIEPDRVAHLFPDGVRPDVLDGVTYLGLVPFVMRGAGPGRVPVPFFGTFCETNVRLYSVDDQDRHGIVFLTLEAQRLATVLLARFSLGLPYTWSRMAATVRGAEHGYTSIRRWPDRWSTVGERGTVSGPRSDVVLRVGAPTSPTDREVWLTARWGLHTRVAGHTVWVPNEHPSWPLHEAELLHLDEGLTAASGAPVTGLPTERVLWSPGVHTTFGLPSTVAG